nr:unnamed protein product [Digitaria exilis]
MAAAVEMSWERMKGKVRWFNATKGTGFVTPDGGNEYLFFHESSLKSGGSHGLKVDDSVEFEF